MGDKTNSLGFWQIVAHFIATTIKAFLVWIMNYYLLIVIKPKTKNTLEFASIFIILNVLNTLFAQWLGMFFFPKFGIVASENGIFHILRHIFVIILTFVVLHYLKYKSINQQLQGKYNKLLNDFLDTTVQNSNAVSENKVSQEYTHNFLVSFRNKIIPISSEKIGLFCLEFGNLYLFTFTEEKFLFHKTLNKLEKELDPADFFKINRQIIINKKSVVEMVKLDDRRLKIITTIPVDFDIIVSRLNVNDFIKWYNS
ncbi:LytTR family DNA-binding domain-containing protein [Aquimarina pacifica]|uniref:LytTR family DNA-binding domain-containing protein n=1 Tax=Aquimarina pacifica TaxID=1296415 RepID=UPI00054D61D1|nr:LytTR family DNA-binding domain-containing protein [Aquimarina pacifica]